MFSYPLMVGIQEISARIGRITGRGIAGNLRRHYPGWLSRSVVALLLVANVINLGADLGAMGAALKLLIAGPARSMSARSACSRGARDLHTLFALRLRAEVAVPRVVQLCDLRVRRRRAWAEVAKAMILRASLRTRPMSWRSSPYWARRSAPICFFWQAEQEVEDEKERPGAYPLIDTPEQAASEFSRIRLDTSVGMLIIQLIALCIVIHDGRDASRARPHAHPDLGGCGRSAARGRRAAFAFAVFAAGIIGTGMLTLPVLSGSAAYAVGETALAGASVLRSGPRAPRRSMP
ncbi:MAG: divalent metal cation transporter [Pararobbsia sp.]